MLLGLSACFSASKDGTPELPFDPRTGVLREQVWQRWLDWDPVRMAPRYADALRSLRAVWLGCGDPRRVVPRRRSLKRSATSSVPSGLPDERVHFELFDAGPRRDRLPLPTRAELAVSPDR